MLQFSKPLLLLNLLFSLLVLSFGYHHLAAENGLLENLQAMFLLLGAIAYFRLAAYSDGDGRLGWTGTGLLCLSFFTREVDLELIPVFEHIGFMFYGNGRTIMLLLLWSFYIRLVVSQGSVKVRLFGLWSSKYIRYLCLCFLLLVIGAIFDGKLFVVKYAVLFEELAETNAFLYLLFPALNELCVRHRQSLDSTDILTIEGEETPLL
ncbi:hypothetical protein OAI12_01980 [Porticoccaceae bacterium]|nr:hypothetical protein [Porticoccaceae bacterium]